MAGSLFIPLSHLPSQSSLINEPNTESFLLLMEEEDEEKMMGAIESLRNPTIGPIHPPLPTWKLYDNPHYSCHDSPHQHNSYNFVPPHVSSSAAKYASFFRPMDCAGAGADTPSELDLARARIEELKVEVEFERRMRRRVESLNRTLARDLADERKAREAAEGLCAKLEEDVAKAKEEVGKMMEEVEEERRMLRVAEVWREERVQMKLGEARIIMEEKLQEIALASKASESLKGDDFFKRMAQPGTPTIAASSNENHCTADGGGGGGGSGQGNHQRREVENPHIRRGITGFVEFPKGLRVKASGAGPGAGKDGKGAHMGFNLECQKAQLRILMRHHKNPPGLGLVGTSDNLVM